MRALETEVVDAVWAAVEPLLPTPPSDGRSVRDSWRLAGRERSRDPRRIHRRLHGLVGFVYDVSTGLLNQVD